MKILFSFLALLLLLTGCNQTQPAVVKNINQEPSWVMNPNENGKAGAIGVAGRSYDQKISTQRKLAITRALDELSLQQGVEVSLNITKTEVVTQNDASMSMDTKSSYKSSSTLTAHIEQVWKDPRTYELYVWMVID